MSDLGIAISVITSKAATIKGLWKYYDGNPTLKYTADRLKEAFANKFTYFAENWCNVIIDAALDRIVLAGFDTGKVDLNKKLSGIFTRCRLSTEINDVHLSALVTGYGYIIGWVDDKNQPEAYYNEPSLCAVFFDDDKPNVVRYAAKMWQGADKLYRANLYYADRIEHYRTKKGEDKATEAAFEKLADDANAYGIVPVFQVINSGRGIGDLSKSILSLQDAVNKLLSDMMITAEFQAFPQRWVISQAATDQLRNNPSEIWTIPPGDGVGQQTTVGQFEPANLDVFLKAIDQLSHSMQVQSRTPKHYFYEQGGDPSGDALIAMESPLNKRVEGKKERFTQTWQGFASFMLKLTGSDVPADQIKVLWKEVSTQQPKAQAETGKIRKDMGLPLLTILRNEGWTDDQIEKLKKDIADDKEASISIATAAIERARRMAEQNNNPDGGTSGDNAAGNNAAGGNLNNAQK